jgi:hypothetical protein
MEYKINKFKINLPEMYTTGSASKINLELRYIGSFKELTDTLEDLIIESEEDASKIFQIMYVYNLN